MGGIEFGGNLRFPLRTSDPGSPAEGEAWYRTDTNEFKIYDGTAARDALSTLYNAQGDLLVGLTDDSPTRLAVGTDGQVLTADSGETSGLKWATPSSGVPDPDHFVASDTASQTISDSTNEALDFATDVTSQSITKDAGTDTFTITTAGLYLVTAYCTWDANTNGRRWLRISHGGTTISEVAVNAQDSLVQNVTGVVDAAASATVEIVVRQNSTANRSVTDRRVAIVQLGDS